MKHLNWYLIKLIDRTGVKKDDHIVAFTSQEAADLIRKGWPGCYIQRISVTMYDWA